jgi:hypothetical protein
MRELELKTETRNECSASHVPGDTQPRACWGEKEKKRKE